MQQGEQPSQAQPFEGMPEPQQTNQEQHLKTIAVRVEEGLHSLSAGRPTDIWRIRER